MHFQQALVYAMDRQHVSLSELAARTGANPRWLTAITTNAEWRPKLDTILRLCHALRINVLDYLTYAEADSCGQAPSSKLQAPSSKLQAVDDDGALILELQPRHISLAFRHFRLKRGLSQYKLEQLTPFSIHTICMRESVHYQNFPTVTTLYSYCDAYDITLTEFIACAFSFVTIDMTMI